MIGTDLLAGCRRQGCRLQREALEAAMTTAIATAIVTGTVIGTVTATAVVITSAIAGVEGTGVMMTRE